MRQGRWPGPSYTAGMRHYLALLFFGLVACGGGSAGPSDESALANTDSGINGSDGELVSSTLQDLFEDCLASDATDFAVLLETMEGFLDQDSEIPIPQFDQFRYLDQAFAPTDALPAMERAWAEHTRDISACRNWSWRDPLIPNQ